MGEGRGHRPGAPVTRADIYIYILNTPQKKGTLFLGGKVAGAQAPFEVCLCMWQVKVPHVKSFPNSLLIRFFVMERS